MRDGHLTAVRLVSRELGDARGHPESEECCCSREHHAVISILGSFIANFSSRFTCGPTDPHCVPVG